LLHGSFICLGSLFRLRGFALPARPQTDSFPSRLCVHPIVALSPLLKMLRSWPVRYAISHSVFNRPPHTSFMIERFLRGSLAFCTTHFDPNLRRLFPPGIAFKLHSSLFRNHFEISHGASSETRARQTRPLLSPFLPFHFPLRSLFAASPSR